MPGSGSVHLLTPFETLYRKAQSLTVTSLGARRYSSDQVSYLLIQAQYTAAACIIHCRGI